jgi:S1-C subfamily serine protease
MCAAWSPSHPDLGQDQAPHMSVTSADSIFLVTSGDPTVQTFGTAFLVHRDANTSYLLTCAHVVSDVGGPGRVIAGGKAAEVIACGELPSDIAVLRVEGLSQALAVELTKGGSPGDRIRAVGFQMFGDTYLIRPLRGLLGAQLELASQYGSERVRAWDIGVLDEYRLQPGYSGSPLVDEASGRATGIVTHRLGDGQKGMALSVEVLESIWDQLPAGLLHTPSPTSVKTTTPAAPSMLVRLKLCALNERIEMLGKQYDALNRQLIGTLDAGQAQKILYQFSGLEAEISAIEAELQALGKS